MQVTVTNHQGLLAVDAERLASAAGRVLSDAGRTAGSLSVAVVDDQTIRPLNARFLAHDWATDVLSFALIDDGRRLEGEVIASAETAARNCQEYGWSAGEELLLCVLHGVLHLVGYRDKTDAEAAAMRRAEGRYLRLAGVTPPEPTGAPSGPEPKALSER